MQVDVSAILRDNGASLELDFEKEPYEREPVDGYFIDGKISFKGKLTNRNGILLLEGQLDALYMTECYRCLKPLRNALKLKIKENFFERDNSEELSMYLFEGKMLDISKALNDNIILNLPMKQLCSVDCSGLCAACGANLNEVQCVCCNNEIDPRLEGLSRYFDKL